MAFAQRKRLGDTFPKIGREGFGKHIQIRDTRVVAVGTSPKGASLIKRLGLNGAVHVKRRESRKLELRVYEKLLAILNAERERGTRSPEELSALEEDLTAKFSPVFDDPPPPSDLSPECACVSRPGTAAA